MKAILQLTLRNKKFLPFIIIVRHLIIHDMHVHIDTYISICFRFYVTTFIMLIILMLKNPVRFFVIWRLSLIEDNFYAVRFMTFLEPSWVNMNIYLEKILLRWIMIAMATLDFSTTLQQFISEYNAVINFIFA